MLRMFVLMKDKNVFIMNKCVLNWMEMVSVWLMKEFVGAWSQCVESIELSVPLRGFLHVLLTGS
jgi:hypothetical protein